MTSHITSMRTSSADVGCFETGPLISVIIPTYNRAPLLRRTLAEYRRQTYRADRFELIVVSDGSTDDTDAVVDAAVADLPYQLKFATVPHAGPAAARNRGIELARGEHILFTGDDIFPDPRLLEQHALASANNPSAGILGFIEWSTDLEVTDFMRFVAPAGPQFDYTDIKDPLNCGHAKFYGANISIPAGWAHQERFDETISSATVEDHEYGYRLEKRGLRIVYNPLAVGFHYHPMTHASFLERLEQAGKAIRYLWEIHPELEKQLRPLPLLPIGLLRSVLRLAPACRLVSQKLFWQLTLMESYLRGIGSVRTDTQTSVPRQRR